MRKGIKIFAAAVMTVAVLAGIAVWLISGTSTCTVAQNPPREYVNPVGDKFPIGGWYAFPKDCIPSDEQFQQVIDAGINIGHQMVNDTATMVRVLEKAQKYNLKMAFMSDAIVNTRLLPSTVERLRKYPMFWGVFLQDEPKMKDFPNLKKMYDIVRSVDDSVGCYVNLWPAWNAKDVGASSFQEYVDEFISSCHPRFLSIDDYPLIKDKNGVRMASRYYYLYEEVSRIAAENGIPFAAVGLSTAVDDLAWPDENNMRFGAFVPLAYGAQSIIWWLYSQSPNPHPEFLSFPIGYNGKRTPIWYAMKKVNGEIQALRHVFMDSEVLGVWHTGSSLPIGTKRLSTPPAPCVSISAGDSGVMVSHLRTKGVEYMVIINHDVKKKQNVNLGWRPDSNVRRIMPDGSERTKIDNRISLSPGGYAIYKLTQP